jgi:hypothetical protein
MSDKSSFVLSLNPYFLHHRIHPFLDQGDLVPIFLLWYDFGAFDTQVPFTFLAVRLASAFCAAVRYGL